MAKTPQPPNKKKLSKAAYRRKIIAEGKRRRGTLQEVGRPTDYDPEYIYLVLEMGEMGKSNESIITSIGCSKQTFYTWCRIYPEFLDAVKKAKIARLAWWEDAGQGSASGKTKGNSSIIAFVKRNISANIDEVESAPYKQKIEFEGRTEVVKDVKDVSPEEIAALDDEKKRKLIEALGEDDAG